LLLLALLKLLLLLPESHHRIFKSRDAHARGLRNTKHAFRLFRGCV